MNLNFCVRWLQPIAIGGSHCKLQIADFRLRLVNARFVKSEILNPKSAIR
jgi:hypothetical protein